MLSKVGRKRPRFSLREKLLLIGIAVLFLVVVILGVLTALTVLARGPQPKPTAVPSAPSAPTSVPVLLPSIRVSPQEAEPGRLVLLTGDGWMPGDEASVHVIAASGDQWLVAQTMVGQDGSFVAPFILPVDLGSSGGSSVVVSASSAVMGQKMSTLMPVLAADVPFSPPPTAEPTRDSAETRTAPSPATATPVPIIQGWRGEYFSNTYLGGVPILVRDDRSVDFVWGAGAPDTLLPADGFSARWTRTLALEAGTYRFYALSDDGVRVWLDGVLIIDRWHDAPSVTYMAERTLSPGAHTFRVEYYESAEAAQIKFWWERTGDFPQWRGEYWSNPSLSGTLALIRNDGRLDFNWGWGSPAAGLPSDGFSARWTRTAHFEAATYRFHVLVDDGARLYVDDHLILDTWTDGSLREVRRDYLLTRGAHDLRVEFYEQTGEARIRVRWEQVATSFSDWKGEYWSNRKLDGKPVLIRNDKSIDFQWGVGPAGRDLPTDNFSVRWSRKVTFERGVYRLYAWADDGIRLYLDGELVLSEWHESSGEEVYVVDLELAGQKSLVVEYYDRSGQALAKVWWKRVGDWPTPAPTATPSPTPDPTATPTATPEPTATPTATPEPTATPTSEPGPTGVRLNELLPVPLQDGIADEMDEWVELHNAGSVAVDLSGWLLDDGEGGSEPYRIPEGTAVLPGAFLLFHGRVTGLVLDDTGDMVRLIDLDGAVVDSVAFGELAPNASYSRDDAGTWHADWQPSPGLPNQPPPAPAGAYPWQGLFESHIVLGLFPR